MNQELTKPIYYSDKIYQCPFEYFNTYSGEIFLRISDYIPEANFPDYMFISNYGRVYNGYREKICNINTYLERGNTNTYVSIRIPYMRKSYPLHRVELSCFGENNLFNYDLQPDHINGIKNDNRINLFNPEKNNLEWVTRRENINRAYNLGLSKTGEKNIHANITEATAMKAIELLATGQYTSRQIVEIVGDPNLTIPIVDDIRKKEAWARQSEGYEFHQRINRQFTEEDVHHFCQVFQRLSQENSTLIINERCRIALIENGFEPSMRHVETLRKIYVRKYYHHITSQYIW